MTINILSHKYYDTYKKLFNYPIAYYKIIINNILYNYIYYSNQLCNEAPICKIMADHYQIFITLPLEKDINTNLADNSIFAVAMLLNKPIHKLSNYLIITNISRPIYMLSLQSKIDAFLLYSKRYSQESNIKKNKHYKLRVNNLFSSHDVTECIAALTHLKSHPSTSKYTLISCHYNYIQGLPYTASFYLSLHLPIILASIGIAFKHLEVGGDLILFMTIINIHIPSVQKLLTILSHAFTNCTVAQDSINQNCLYQIAEYYIKCTSYHGNITDTQMNELIQLGIDHADLQYAICDVMQYYDRYSAEHPKQTLFYGNIETSTEISITRKKSSKRKSSKQPSIKTALFNSPSTSASRKKTKISHPPMQLFSGDIKYLSDFELTDYAAMQADSATQYKYIIISNAIEGLFISCFQGINNHIVNSIEQTSSGLRVKPYIISQIKYSNMQKFVFMLEYNKIAYNKHILGIMKQEQNNLIDTFYGMDNAITAPLIKYTDSITLGKLREKYTNFKLGIPTNNAVMDYQCGRIDIAYQVKVNLLSVIGIDTIPRIVQLGYEDFTRGLKNFINAKYAAGLPTKKGVSNAFLKLWEILTIFDIIPRSNKSKPTKMRTLHMCEAPGQMILCMLHYISRKHHGGIDYDWRSNSLNPYNKINQDIHGDTKIFGDDYGLIKKYPEKWLWGADNTGDVTRIANIEWFREYVHNWGRVDVVIGDGGVSTGLPPIMLQKLDLAQVLMVLNCCSRGGKCIVKHFTPYIKLRAETNNASGFFIGFLYLYYMAFETVSLHKPYTSNPDSGEFYVIGNKFRDDIQPSELARLNKLLDKFELNATIINMEDIPETFILQIERFIDKITDINVMGEEKQNMLLTCYKYGKDANVQKYLQCDKFMDENSLKSILYPRYAEWIKKFTFL